MPEQNSSARARRYSATATIIAVMVTAALILVNSIAFILVDRYNFKADMTSQKIYELTDLTRGILADLDEDITITAMNNERDFLSEMNEVVKRYDRASDRITLRYVDPYSNPTFVDKYQKEGVTLEENSVLVESAAARKVFTVYDMYTFNSDMTAVSTFNAEQQLTSAILYVTSDDLPSVAFTMGHNEERSNTLTNLFEKNNFAVSDVTVSMQGVPEDTDIVVICAPTRDFSSDEVDALDKFLIERGGKMMVFLQPGTEAMPVLEEFLAEWGVGVQSEVVFEKQNFIASNPIYIIASYTQHQINSYFADNRYYTIMPAARALTQLFDHKGNVSTSPVLMATKDAYGKVGTSFGTIDREPGDTGGPFVLAITSEMHNMVGTNAVDSKMFVAGSKAMYADDVLGSTSFGNADFISQVISWCSDDMEIVNVPAKTTNTPPLNIKTFQAFLLGGLFIVVIPLAILGYGVMVWLRRRHL